MSNVMIELKSEIVRLARKEIKQALAPAKRVTAAQRGLIAGLRRQVVAMQKELNALKKTVPASGKPRQPPAEPAGRFWITGKGVKTLRKRLGLTQQAFGQLVGVSSQAVVKWEAQKGKLGLRKATAGKLQEIRGLGKRDVAGMMGKGKAKTAKKSPRKAKPKRKANKA
jgi:DNA-binding transcriptional regulator YiaG